MDGLTWITGCGPTITLEGQTLIARGRSLRDYGIIEAEIICRRGNPFDRMRFVARMVKEDSSAERDGLARLFNDISARWCRVNRAEVFAWLDTWPGRLFALWLAVRKNYPGRCSLEFLVEQADTIDWPRALEAMAIANGEDERGTIDLLAATDARHDAPIPWGAIYRRLAEHPFHMSAEEIGHLTLRQLLVLLVGTDELAERIDFPSAADMQSWRLRREAMVSTAIDNLRRGLRWDSQELRTHNAG